MVFFSKFKFTHVPSVPDSVDIAGLLFISHLTHVRHYAQLCLPWLLVSVHTQT